MASHRSSPSLVPRPCSLGTRLTSALFCIPKTIESSGLGMRLDGRWFGNETQRKVHVVWKMRVMSGLGMRLRFRGRWFRNALQRQVV